MREDGISFGPGIEKIGPGKADSPAVAAERAAITHNKAQIEAVLSEYGEGDPGETSSGNPLQAPGKKYGGRQTGWGAPGRTWAEASGEVAPSEGHGEGPNRG